MTRRLAVLVLVAVMTATMGVGRAGAVPCIDSPCGVERPGIGDIPDPGFSTDNRVIHGHVKYTILEQFGVTATEVVTGMSYWENPNAVYGPDDLPGSCYHSGFPGWTIRSCVTYLTDASPNMVHKEIIGDFHSATQVEYVQYARYTGVRGGYDLVCNLDQGSLPPGWDQRCMGTRASPD